MKTFKGRVVVPGTCTAEALVSHGGFNTLASYQMGMMFGDKQMKCGDQNNADDGGNTERSVSSVNEEAEEACR